MLGMPSMVCPQNVHKIRFGIKLIFRLVLGPQTHSPAAAIAFYDSRLGAVVVATHSRVWQAGQVWM